MRGKNPIAKGEKGTVLGFVKEEPGSSEIDELCLYTVGEQGIEPGVWYDIRGEKVAK